MLVASGIGDSIADVDEHIGMIMKLIDFDVNKAKQELMNMRHNLVTILQEQDIRHVAFMYFVHSVDGKKWEDFSDSGVKKLYELVIGEKEIALADAERAIREQLDDELRDYFPKVFEGENKNLLDYARKRALLQVDEIVNDCSHEDEIKKLSELLTIGYKPMIFEGSESAELQFDKQFEQMCLAISKEFGGKAKDYTIMEYYSAYERLEAINKELDRIRRK